MRTSRDPAVAVGLSRHQADKVLHYAFLSTETSSATTTSLPVINGVRTSSGTLPTMDGIAVTAYSGGASPVTQPRRGAEVNVVTANAPAELAVAANFTVVTKSGTNDLRRCILHIQWQRPELPQLFQSSTPFRVYNTLAAVWAGPSKRTKPSFSPTMRARVNQPDGCDCGYSASRMAGGEFQRWA